MQTRTVVIVPFLALSLLVACRSAPPQDASSTAPRPSSSTATAPTPAPPSSLQDLRRALDEVRSAAPDASVRTGGDQPLDALVGLTREAIRAALGEPHTCVEDGYRDELGMAHPVAPCRTREDWFYSFYHLPEGSPGGGPELLLQFDAAGACTSASWAFTQ